MAGNSRQRKEAPPTKGWLRVLDVLRHWGILGAVITATVALVVFLANNTRTHYRDDGAHASEEIAFRTRTDANFNNLSAAIARLEADIRELRGPWRNRLSDLRDADKATFAKSLPDLRKVSEQSPSEVMASVTELDAIRNRLSQTPPTAPEYWPTVMQFLRFASASASAPSLPARLSRLTLRNIKFGGTPTGLPLNRIAGADLVLDGGDLFDAVIANSRVTFTNNAVNLRNVTFVNCVFVFPVSDTPPEQHKQATQQLLAASDLRSVSMSL
jgi:hypothetical protein